ncbi:argininosuccinate synthase domain-containing protein [Sulfobacillus thermosulfidooxidans]|uniref:argininosuccinate synthase domain-containing protein n=1 Tax=Sulfobacillus thermosulfidooxidans TaxID=28034 RepID=UPI0006B547FB|nr:argininosuccinate synthase domain-containing protein [Sulfobacillus thermosulfidooxidans]
MPWETTSDLVPVNPPVADGAVILFSGGTDSMVCAVLAQMQWGNNVTLLTIDIGMSATDRQKALTRAQELGLQHVLWDGRDAFVDEYLTVAIHMNADYQGFPLGTPLARALMFATSRRYLLGRRRVLIIGSTRRQNTRIRADLAFSDDPHTVVWTPIADALMTRSDKVRYLMEHGITIHHEDHFSTDENIWTRVIESHAMNDLSRDPDERCFSWTRPLSKTPDKPESLMIEFEQGLPVALNQERMPLRTIIETLNTVGGVHGIGRRITIEDTLLGDKIRTCYEAPAATVIQVTHRHLESLVLTKHERDEKSQWDRAWAELVYAGAWNSPRARDLVTGAWPIRYRINGQLRVELFKGHVLIVGGEVPDSRIIPVERAGLY